MLKRYSGVRSVAALLICVFAGADASARAGELFDAAEAQRRVEAARRAANPKRPETVVMETRPAGRRYRSQVDVKLVGRAANADWGMTREGNATFAATLAYQSHIVANDGAVVVEERRYETLTTALVVTADRVKFDFLNPRAVRDGAMALLALESPTTAIATRKALGWILDELGVELGDNDIAFNERVVLSKKDGELFSELRIDGLAGKTVRIVYANDGGGIREITPVDCEISPEEERLIRQGCYLFDAAFLDDGVRRVGDRWPVSAGVFGNLLNGVAEGEPTGKLQFERRPDVERTDAAGQTRDQVVLAIDRDATGEIRFQQIVERENGYHYEEAGTLRGLEGAAYFVRAPGEGGAEAEMYLHQLEAKGLAELNVRSRDHLLFQARFSAAPTAELRYLCFPLEAVE